MSESLSFRQIHLDFHTSEKILNVGEKFNAKQFQEMLKRGHVDSITLFSKCHHGMSYHDTKVGLRHPGLSQELLPRQIEACQEVGVKTPIYISAGFDEYAARMHPEWQIVGKDGSTFPPLRAGWRRLDYASPYLDYLCDQIEEVIDRFHGGDGIFLDIITAWHSHSVWRLLKMSELGLDAGNDDHVETYAQMVLQEYFRRTNEICHSQNPELRIFHNSGHIPKGATQIMHWNTHLELESLPTGGWGYDHFPISAKYAATTGMDFLGMTGKFHTSWGEFGGFKRPEALRYECAAMLAYGSKCSIGDQLHPDGEMNEDTYHLIGAAYADVEAKEEYCGNVVAESEIALVSPEALHADRPGGHNRSFHAEEGAGRMLLELHAQFDVVDLDHDLSPYKMVVLPDEILLHGDFAAKIKEFLADGGKLLLSGKSGLSDDGHDFVLDFPCHVEGRSNFDPDYIIPTAKTPTPPVRGPFVIHGGCWNIVPEDGLEVLATRAVPYFNRTWEHFCSHQHTPDAASTDYPAVVGNDQIVYFAHDIFTRYRRYGQPLYRDLVRDALKHLLGDLAVEVKNFPSTGRAALQRQAGHNRLVLHLLFATPVLRGARDGENATAVEVIEDIVPLHNLECTVRVAEEIKAVRLAPTGGALEYSQENGAVRFVVPRLECHQMVTLNF